jgi:hypothetical protein
MIFNIFTLDGITKLSAYFTMTGVEQECYIETPVEHDTSNDELNEQFLRNALGRLQPDGITEEQILSITFIEKLGD